MLRPFTTLQILKTTQRDLKIASILAGKSIVDYGEMCLRIGMKALKEAGEKISPEEKEKAQKKAALEALEATAETLREEDEQRTIEYQVGTDEWYKNLPKKVQLCMDCAGEHVNGEECNGPMKHLFMGQK